MISALFYFQPALKRFFNNSYIDIRLVLPEIWKEAKLTNLIRVNHLQELRLQIATGALSSLRQFLETESSLKMMGNVFYFTLKALLILIFKFFSWTFGHVKNRID